MSLSLQYSSSNQQRAEDDGMEKSGLWLRDAALLGQTLHQVTNVSLKFFVKSF